MQILNGSETEVLTLDDKICYVSVYLRSYYVATLPDWTVPRSKELQHPNEDQTNAFFHLFHLSATGRFSSQCCPTLSLLHSLIGLRPFSLKSVEAVYSYVDGLNVFQLSCCITAITYCLCVIETSSKEKYAKCCPVML